VPRGTLVAQLLTFLVGVAFGRAVAKLLRIPPVLEKGK